MLEIELALHRLSGDERRHHVGRAVLVVAILVPVFGATPARADIGPPVKIRMPINTKQAISGQGFAGVFEIDLGKPGTIDDVEITGEGWTIQSIEKPAVNRVHRAGTVRVPFRAAPSNADAPITMSLRFNGRPISRAYRIGPEAFARRGKDRPAIQTAPGVRQPPIATEQADGDPEPEPQDGVTLRFTGRIVYDRPESVDLDNGSPLEDYTEEGVHGIWVQVMDEDDISDEVVWEGFTDKDGYFDSGSFTWDDCDVTGCDEPDLYLRWECDTSVVNVQDAEDITEPDYSWSTVDNVIEDFTGSFYGFGSVKPLLPSHMPVLHIHNSIYRARLFIEFKSGGGYVVPELDVLYPDGDNAFYDTFFEEIHISLFRRWMEATHTHEYGHHFLENFAVNTTPDYCNGYCDGDDCGHCIWCQENATDAWNEGWPHWLADIVTRDYPNEYTFSDGTPYTALVGRNLETVQMCMEDNPATFHDALITEGFATALLIDIEDDTQDPTPGTMCTTGQDNATVIERQDCLAMGPEEIFYVTTAFQPTTPEEFITLFQVLYPEAMPALYVTARHNMFPADLFPTDTDPPGAVQSVVSSSHPLGQGGPLPCITVDWDTPPDDVTGGKAYSIEWSTSPAGVEPDTNCEIAGTCVSVTDGPFRVDDYYLSIKAIDGADRWSNEWATFGPFTVTDCNGNGITDVCEIGCSWTGSACWDGSWCQGETDCGFAPDCQPNLVPDDCDIASGTSGDCNENGVPDECEPMKHWASLSGSWHDGGNWEELTVPVDGDHVCIQVPDYDATVTFSRTTLQIPTLSCTENLSLRTGPVLGNPAYMTVDEGGFIDGDLELRTGSSDVRLTLNDDMVVQGVLNWEGGTLRASDTTIALSVLGGMSLTGLTTLDKLTLFLPGPTVSTNRIVMNGGPTVINTSTYDHQVDGDAFSNTGGTFDNQGTFVRSAGDGTARIGCKLINSGEVQAETGKLQIGWASGATVTSTGTIRGLPGTTIEFNYTGHSILPGSTLIADTLVFSSGSISGSVDVSSQFSVTGSTTITSDANVINYSPIMSISGSATFDAVVGETVYFDQLSGGAINWNTNDPIVTNTLSINHTFNIPPSLTVNGQLAWLACAAFVGPGVIDVNGDIVFGGGNCQRTLNNAELNNAGTVLFTKGFSCTNGAAVNNLATGVMDIQLDSTIMSGSSPLFNNAGMVVKTAGIGTSTIHPIASSTGVIESRIGLLEFRNLTQTAGEILLNGGNFGMYQLSTPQPLKLMGGVLRGSGTVIGVVENTGAKVEPGLSVGLLNISGNSYTHGPGAKLTIELGGLTPGTEHDQLAVTGTVNLQGGELEVLPFGTFQPKPGDEFVVLTAGTVQGAFDTVSGPGQYTVTYHPTSVTVSVVVSPPCGAAVLGDFDDDCDVDGDDFLEFVACADGPEIPLGAPCQYVDFDGDGDGDQADFASFQNCISGEEIPADPACVQ